MIDCDASNANYISKTFVREMKAIFLEEYFSKVISVDDKKLTSTAYNALYAIKFSAQENTSSVHIFRAIDMKARVILDLSWLQSVNSVIDWKFKNVIISNNIEVLQSSNYIRQCEKVQQKTYVCFSKDDVTKEMLRCLKLFQAIQMKIFFDLIEYADVFSENEINELSPHKESFDHFIDLLFEKNSSFESIYNLSENELKMLKDYIDKNFVNEFIARSKSSVEASILFIKKKNDELKLCVDYRELNAISIKNKYFISLVINILNRLKRTKIFTKLDIREVYNLIRIKFEDEWKTAFKTRYENFEYRVLSFELTSGFATFQFYIDRALTNCFDKFCICYLNDILIYSNNVREHNDHVKTVLTALRKHRLFVKLEKCSFERDWVNYLRFIINTEDIIMNSAKMKTIMFWSTSKSIKEMQSFLEFCNFYRRFIQKYSEVTLSMTNDTKMIKFLWTKNT